nr:PilZ domain-containing protein [uncultured Cohaesibacter sp.]
MTLHLENRTSRRRRVLKGGKIFYNNFCFSADCVIRNQGADGMMLSVSSALQLPENFAIFSRKDGKLASARMIWRRGDRLGIKLTSDMEEVWDSNRPHIRQMSTMITH